MLAEQAIRQPQRFETPANLFQVWKELNIILNTLLWRESKIKDLIMMARKRKPSGRNKKERRRKKGIILPSEVNHDRNAGIAHGLIIGGKGGVKVRVHRKTPKNS